MDGGLADRRTLPRRRAPSRPAVRRTARAAPAPRRRRASRLPPAAAGRWRSVAATAGPLRRGAAGVWRRPRLRAALVACLLAVAVLLGGWLWLRDSSLVSVQRVRISGVS